jgi:hypothetical protein
MMLSSDVPPDKSVLLLEVTRKTKSIKEIVIITKINPASHVASFEVPEEYDQVLKIGRNNIESMKDLRKAINHIKRMHKAGEKYFSIKTSSGTMWFNLNKLLSKKRKR